MLLPLLIMCVISNFHIYIYIYIYDIYTAQVPWWVKFLRACSRQCKKNPQKNRKPQTTIYIWTVHIYRLYRKQCAKYTYCTYTQYTQCTIKTYLVTNTPIHIIHRMYTSALCPHLCIVICEGATDYNLQIVVQGATDYAYAMSWVCFVWCPVIADVLVQCVRVVW